MKFRMVSKFIIRECDLKVNPGRGSYHMNFHLVYWNRRAQRRVNRYMRRKVKRLDAESTGVDATWTPQAAAKEFNITEIDAAIVLAERGFRRG